MNSSTTSDGRTGSERGAEVRRRVRRRIEARNELAAADAPGAFDFRVDDRAMDGLGVGILASYLGAAACGQSFALGLVIDVGRVVVEIEDPPTRSGGGTPARDAGARDHDHDRNHDHDRDHDRDATRVRALVEAHTDEPADAIARWRGRLVADHLPFAIVPELVGLDVLVTSTPTASRRSSSTTPAASPSPSTSTRSAAVPSPRADRADADD
jgi:hypothetical protein